MYGFCKRARHRSRFTLCTQRQACRHRRLRNRQATFLSDGQVVAEGRPEQVAQSAPATAFLVSNVRPQHAHQLIQDIKTVQGVIASYLHGPNIHVVGPKDIEESLRQAIRASGASLDSVPMRLEDVGLAFASHSLRSSEKRA